MKTVGDSFSYDEDGYLDISALYTYLSKAMPEQPPSRSNEGSDRFILDYTDSFV